MYLYSNLPKYTLISSWTFSNECFAKIADQKMAESNLVDLKDLL